MKKRWLSLFGVLSVIFFVFLVKTGIQISGYVSLDSESEAKIDKWQVVEKKDDAFAIIASYHFFFEGQKIVGETEFAKPYFFNDTSAKKAVQKLSSQPWNVFFQKDTPSKNSLQRKFPFQACIHTFFILGLLIYSIFLKKWIERSLVQ